MNPEELENTSMISARQMEANKTVGTQEMENFMQYLTAVGLSMLVVDRDYWNLAIHEDVNAGNIVNFVSDGSVKALVVSKC